MKTLIALANSNCTWCRNEILGTLREKEGVRGVQSDFSSGCLVIEHEDDPDVLLSLVTTAGRAVAVAGNGEREMVPVDGREAVSCRTATDIADASMEEGNQLLAAVSPDAIGAMASILQSPTDSRSSGMTLCPVCRPGGPSAGKGVRVLTRERPTPGLILRATWLVLRTYRVVFRLPVAPR